MEAAMLSLGLVDRRAQEQPNASPLFGVGVRIVSLFGANGLRKMAPPCST